MILYFRTTRISSRCFMKLFFSQSNPDWCTAVFYLCGIKTCVFPRWLTFSSVSAFTAEQYQQHQEQLSLMHKQQLEQIQQQHQANSTANSTQVGRPPPCGRHALRRWVSPKLSFSSSHRVWRTRWMRPALTSLPRPSSPPNNCWLWKPRTSWPWEAESMASSPQVQPTTQTLHPRVSLDETPKISPQIK